MMITEIHQCLQEKDRLLKLKSNNLRLNLWLTTETTFLLILTKVQKFNITINLQFNSMSNKQLHSNNKCTKDSLQAFSKHLLLSNKRMHHLSKQRSLRARWNHWHLNHQSIIQQLVVPIHLEDIKKTSQINSKVKCKWNQDLQSPNRLKKN